ncbi:unnamed protein product [Rotaria magnacalcarata]|uniref:Uncharacterized protein n=2 Tax=Rotaria magnacalcarata TaxID=392030 RepID=A0A816WY81_9BILA|nr:unnamed protein product [Rotaria magnacalcarata]CAF1428416.1 unnamed protein product [Rotaria magnacalcarata]CAF1981756.1 unnamed protein product [Rotaria magnacalcarata]CAF2139334.1 unnamed protein product [Rotaria magnacalcarata]CAF2170129.1 unnamed protein product [Rotaria magnacalcarata]
MALDASSLNSFKTNERDCYQCERSPYSFVTPAALIYHATDRIKSLARPKIRKDTTIREGFSRYISDPTYSGVSKAAIRAQCSSHLSDLALPLKRHQSFTYELPIPRPVSRVALRYEATERVHELAVPKKRHSAR